MRLVIALGGNALLKRGEPMLCENQRENVSLACRQIAKAYAGNELVVTHGNGPQVGLLALQNNAYKKVPAGSCTQSCRRIQHQSRPRDTSELSYTHCFAVQAAPLEDHCRA